MTQKPGDEADSIAGMTDEEIVRRVLVGKSDLFELLVHRHSRRLYRAIRVVVRESWEAEDVLQQTLANAYQHLDQFAGKAKFSTWLTRIGMNEAHARSRDRNSFASETEGGKESLGVTSTMPNPEEETLKHELQRILEREILEMLPAYRTVLVLRDVEGLSVAETALSLGVTAAVVKTRLYRARAQLRKRLMERAGLSLKSLFPFPAARCTSVARFVMAQLEIARKPAAPSADGVGSV